MTGGAARDAIHTLAAYPRAAVARTRWPSFLMLAALLFLVGCSGSGSSATVVRYERDWPDGYHEELTITEDGHVTMKHGDVLERLTLTVAQIQQIHDAITAGIPQGDQGDSLVRTVVLPNGTTVSPVKPVAGSAVDMLELLMTTHSMNGAPVPGSTVVPVHALGSPSAP